MILGPDAGVPIWTTLPEPYVNPLLAYGFTFDSSSNGNQVWADIGETRTFTVPPIITLQCVKSEGIVVPLCIVSTTISGLNGLVQRQ